MAILTFGPLSDPWTYDQESRTYDLSRSTGTSASGDNDGPSSQKTKYTFATSNGPPDTKVMISPSLAALVIVDMQNFFLHPKCRDHPNGLAAVEPTAKVIARCRELGVEIIWLNWCLTELDLATIPAAIVRGFSRRAVDKVLPPNSPRPGLGSDMGSNMGRTLMAGSWNAEIYEPLVQHVWPEDVQCAKNRMSGMWSSEQPLFRHLVASGRKTLLFAGVNTDQCVLGTLSDAYSNGWDCILVDDCCGTGTPGGREVCLLNGSGPFGFVVNSKTFTGGIVE